MTDRVAATGESAQACPFVAFEDERDDRSERPDPRHRCFAETPPASRGRSHQETYCLSTAFPACPTFQAWARREAARVQVAKDAQADAAVRLRDVPAQRESQAARDAAAAGLARDAAVRTSSGRDAAAVPIVPARDLVSPQDLAEEAPGDRGRAALEVALAGGAMRAAGPSGGGAAVGSSHAPDSGGDPSLGRGVTGDDGGPSASFDPGAPPLRLTPPPARRQLTDDDDDLASLLGRPPSSDRSDSGYDRSSANSVPPDLAQRRPAQGQWSAPPPWAGGVPPAGDPDGTGADAGSASAAAYSTVNRPTTADPSAAVDSEGRRVVVERPPAEARPRWAAPTDDGAAGAPVTSMAAWEADELEPIATGPTLRRSSSLATLLGWDRRPRAGSSRPGRTAGQAEPPWERPRRYEAYPTIRTRVGLPALSKAALAGLALLVGALALFFIPPLLLHSGGPGPGASGSAAASFSPGAASSSLAPTVAPARTPLTYTVKSGDTLVKIAKKYGLTVEQLLAANKQIKNPNKIAIGDVLVIPQATPSQVLDGGPSSTP